MIVRFSEKESNWGRCKIFEVLKRGDEKKREPALRSDWFWVGRKKVCGGLVC